MRISDWSSDVCSSDLFGQGNYNDQNPWHLEAKLGEYSGKLSVSLYSITGYWPKKLVHFQNTLKPGDGGGYSVVEYPWPVIRLAGLYLLSAEARNEYEGPSAELYHGIDLVRELAGVHSIALARESCRERGRQDVWH